MLNKDKKSPEELGKDSIGWRKTPTHCGSVWLARSFQDWAWDRTPKSYLWVVPVATPVAGGNYWQMQSDLRKVTLTSRKSPFLPR